MNRFFRIILLSVDALLILVFAAGYLARYLHPRYFWWMDIVAVGLPYVTLLLTAATFGVAAARQWGLLSLHIVIIVLAFARFLPGERYNLPPPRADDLVVITYNMSHWWEEGRSERAMKMRTLVERHEPVLITLQEARLELDGASDTLVRALPHVRMLVDSMQYSMIYPDDDRSAYTALPVLAREDVTLLNQSQIALERMRPAAMTSTIVRTVFRWQGREAVLYNLHLRSFGDRKPWEDSDVRSLEPRAWWSYLFRYRRAYLDRAWEAEKIKAMAAEEALPLILAGDFNSTPHSWVYAHLAEDMQDAFLYAGQGWGATYHTNFPFARIDHVLAGPAFEVVRADVLDVALSDHRPLLVRMRWRD